MDVRSGQSRSYDRGTAGRLVWLLENVAKARWTAIATIGAIFFLLLGEVFAPGSNPYYGYQMFQAMVVLVTVLSLDIVFLQQGGLSWLTHGIVSVTVVADVLGTSSNLYHAFGPYDNIVHVSSAAAFAAGGFDILSILSKRGVLVSTPNKRWLVAVAISFLIAGLAWETYEYFADVVFHTDRVQDGFDTRDDLISNVSGALFAATVLWAYERKKESKGEIQESGAPSSSE